MEIEKSIVHILDCEHNTFLPSSACMQEIQEDILKMIETKTAKIFASAKKKTAVFKEDSVVKGWINELHHHLDRFEAISETIARHYFEVKMKAGVYEASDVLMALLTQDGRRYLLLLDNAYQKGITHHLSQNEQIYNEVIPYRTLLSSTLLSKDRGALIELSDAHIACVEAKLEIEAEKVNVLAGLTLQSISAPSYQEAVTTITKTVENMKDKYDLQEVNLVPKMKSILKDHVEKEEQIDVAQVAEVLFADQPLAKDDFKEEVKRQGIIDKIDTEYVKPRKSEKVQKIKTDNGIEIIIPVDYMNSRDYVEFHTQSDGTISIQLKNIGHITSK